MKELKELSLKQYTCQMFPCQWNPVKELKAISGNVKSVLLRAVWNPVKELKVFVSGEGMVLEKVLVESGEGIERGPRRRRQQSG